MLRKIMIAFFLVVLLVAAAVFFYLRQPKFGRAPSPKRLDRIQASPHYYNGKFQCLEPIEKIVETQDGLVGGWMKFFLEKTPNLRPPEPLPTEKTNLLALPLEQDVVVWLGHSSFYLQLGGKKILIDPVLSSYGAPVPFVNKAFAGTNVYKPEDIPPIDVLLLSHEHWDHLDYDTIMALQGRIKEIICPLGVGEYFEQWGFAPEQLHEEDWNTEVKLSSDFSVFLLPAQHYANRLFAQNQTQWAAFALITPGRKVFYSGDSGYGRHFKEIGRQFGGFDLALLEDGQYNKDWPRIHMQPEEVAQAAVDLQAKLVLPCHNGKFALARHAWDEPLQKLSEASQGKPYQLLTPELGALLQLPQPAPTSFWWQEVGKS